MGTETSRPRVSLARDLLAYRAMREEHGYPLPDDAVDELAESAERYGVSRWGLIALLENFEDLLASIGAYMGKVPASHDDMLLFYGRLQSELFIIRYDAERMHPHHVHMLLVLRGQWIDDPFIRGGEAVAESFLETFRGIRSDAHFKEIDPESFRIFALAFEGMMRLAVERASPARISRPDSPSTAALEGPKARDQLPAPVTSDRDAGKPPEPSIPIALGEPDGEPLVCLDAYPEAIIPTEHRSAPMGLAQAARKLGLTGSEQAIRKKIRNAMKAGTITYNQLIGHLYVFDLRQFPAATARRPG